MGWQTSVLFIERDCPNDIPQLLSELGVMEEAEAGEDVDFYTASTSMEFEQVFVGALAGWTIVCGMPVMLAQRQQEYSYTAKVVEMNLSGVSSTYQFAVYIDGVEQRAFIEQEGEVISRGSALPEENELDAFPYTEARILEIVQRCTLLLSAYEDARFLRLIGQASLG